MSNTDRTDRVKTIKIHQLEVLKFTSRPTSLRLRIGVLFAFLVCTAAIAFTGCLFTPQAQQWLVFSLVSASGLLISWVQARKIEQFYLRTMYQIGFDQFLHQTCLKNLVFAQELEKEYALHFGERLNLPKE